MIKNPFKKSKRKLAKKSPKQTQLETDQEEIKRRLRNLGYW